MSVGKAYLLNAALNFWGIENLDGQPTKHVPPPEMPFKTTEKKLDYFNEVIGNFVDEYVAVDPDKENNNSGLAVDDDDDQTDRVRLVYTYILQ